MPWLSIPFLLHTRSPMEFFETCKYTLCYYAELILHRDLIIRCVDSTLKNIDVIKHKKPPNFSRASCGLVRQSPIKNPPSLKLRRAKADRTGLEPKSQSYFESISYKCLWNCTPRIAHYSSLLSSNCKSWTKIKLEQVVRNEISPQL